MIQKFQNEESKFRKVNSKRKYHVSFSLIFNNIFNNRIQPWKFKKKKKKKKKMSSLLLKNRNNIDNTLIKREVKLEDFMEIK